jgi:hypothetical protein
MIRYGSVSNWIWQAVSAKLLGLPACCPLSRMERDVLPVICVETSRGHTHLDAGPARAWSLASNLYCDLPRWLICSPTLVSLWFWIRTLAACLSVLCPSDSHECMTRGLVLQPCSCGGGSTLVVVTFVSTPELIGSSACSVWEIIPVFLSHAGLFRLSNWVIVKLDANWVLKWYIGSRAVRKDVTRCDWVKRGGIDQSNMATASPWKDERSRGDGRTCSPVTSSFAPSFVMRFSLTTHVSDSKANTIDFDLAGPGPNSPFPARLSPSPPLDPDLAALPPAPAASPQREGRVVPLYF